MPMKLVRSLTAKSVTWTTQAARARTAASLLPLSMKKEWGEGKPCQHWTNIWSAEKEPLSPLVSRGERESPRCRPSCGLLNNRPATLLFLCAALFGLSGCTRQTAGPAKDRRTEAVPVVVATVTNVAWDKTVSIIGTLFPKDEATIGPQGEGPVEQTLGDFGHRVQTNQAIAFIDIASYHAQFEQAMGNLAKAQAHVVKARK